ncbi:isopentenyl-diphosphate Delta-isomerase [Corynebacterium choanae]|uniref:isopentenyl-diphosphate Delta-isomerase n=1 Tax=Corynebacterium choanae TaxID=1862358 RepID=UPI000F4E18B8|nr:isopentenyl-diphosphate Delta-isomerase [Corynebacterium choanae]
MTSAAPKPPSTEELVVLCDTTGTPTGTWPKATVHHDDTPLHLAFSAYVLNDAGQLLITRRALHKRTWPGVWTNSMCGHPGPGEQPADAAARRGSEELGIAAADLSQFACILPDFHYRATDSSGVVENEVCPVFITRLRAGASVQPQASEVDAMQWVDPAALWTAVQATPWAFSPWMGWQLEHAELRDALGVL